MPAPAPVTIAVLPFREKRGRTRLDWGAFVLSWANLPSFMVSVMLTLVNRSIY